MVVKSRGREKECLDQLGSDLQFLSEAGCLVDSLSAPPLVIGVNKTMQTFCRPSHTPYSIHTHTTHYRSRNLAKRAKACSEPRLLSRCDPSCRPVEHSLRIEEAEHHCDEIPAIVFFLHHLAYTSKATLFSPPPTHLLPFSHSSPRIPRKNFILTFSAFIISVVAKALVVGITPVDLTYIASSKIRARVELWCSPLQPSVAAL